MPKLFYIAGHGAGDPGATGNNYQEAERVRALGNRVKAIGGDNVILGDFNRNYYADNGISTLNIPKDYCILEAHMDAGQASARGGHVIINSGFTADKYDSALAAMLSSILPGRANMIVGRNDLANPNRAAARGYNYRLVEFGFITNSEDVRIFNSRMDDIACGILNAFGIGKIENYLEGEENMDSWEIMQAKGGKCQYLFTGFNIHPFASQKERDSVENLYKRKTGKSLTTHINTPEEMENLRNVFSRSAK